MRKLFGNSVPRCGRQFYFESREAGPVRSLPAWLGGWRALVTAVCLLATFPEAQAQQSVRAGTPGAARHHVVESARALARFEQLHAPGRAIKATPGVDAGEARFPDDGFAPASVGNIVGSLGTGVTSPPPVINFEALPDNQFTTPPDTHGAVGPDHVMTVLNSEVRIQDRAGNIISTVSLDGFWRPLSPINTFDPKLLYDASAGRWIFVSMDAAFSIQSSVLLAVSQTSDPTGQWNFYSFQGDPNGFYWADYPSLGFNKDWIVVTANMFPIGFGARIINIWVVNKADVYANGTGVFTLFQESSGLSPTMVPAITHDENLSTMYLVDAEEGPVVSSRLRVSTITGNVGAEQITFGTFYVSPGSPWYASDFNFGVGMPQLGSPIGIAANNSRIQNVVVRNGSIWCAHHIFLPAATPNHAAIQWLQFAQDGQIQQGGRIEDTNGVMSFTFPSVAVNRNNDVLIGFSSFSSNQFASASYAFRANDDPASSLRFPYTFKPGEAPYVDFDGVGRNRWGDYSSTVVDPVDDIGMWTIQEYAKLPVQGLPTWGTWWAQVLEVPGVRFEFADYSAGEAPPPGYATITLLNVRGEPGSVEFYTTDGTGIAGQDYIPALGTVNFVAGQTRASVNVQLIDNSVINSNKTVQLHLRNATGRFGLSIITNAVLTIVDDETISVASTAGEFNFSSWVAGGTPYLVTENESDFSITCYPGYFIDRERSALGALITVVRTNGSTGRVFVDYSTVDVGGTAQPFIDYIPVSGTLQFDDHQMSANFVVPITNNFFFSFLPSDLLFFNVQLSNPRPAPEEEMERPGLIRPTLGAGAIGGVSIAKVNQGYLSFSGGTSNVFSYLAAFAFERLHYRVDEYADRAPLVSGGQKVMTVSVIRRLGVGGQVLARTYNHVRGLSAGGENNYPFGNLVGATLSGPTVDAGSDYAVAPVAGDVVFANPIYLDQSQTTITNFADFVARGVVVDFGSSACRREFNVIINNDAEMEFAEDIIIQLIGLPGNPPPHPFADICNVTILPDEQPAGALDREWNPDNVESTEPSYNLTPGANNIVNAVAVQPDNKTVLGGDFTAVNARPRNRIARMNADGSLDTGFNPGTGADGSVTRVLLYPASSTNFGRILIVGGFSSYNGSQRNGIARLQPTGALDTTFRPGNGANGTIYAVAIQADEKILIAGDFTEFNNFSRPGLARLNADGSLDLSFDPGAGTDGPIADVKTVADGLGGEQVLIAGNFLFYGQDYRAGIARLNADGTVDPNFDTGGGANGPVYSIAVESDGRIVLAGAFNEIDARPRIGMARLNPDGTLDETFDAGRGPDNPVYTVTLQPDQKALIGGPFTSYNGTRRKGFARLRRDGSLDTSFLDTAYNQFAGLITTMSYEQPNYVNSIAVQPDGNVIIGGSFTNIGGNPSFLADVPNYYTVFTRADKRVRYNVARVLGGVTPGPGNMDFDVQDYYVDENAGIASLKLQRTDGRLGSIIAEAGTRDRTATIGADFIGTNLVTLWAEGFYQTNVDLTFPILFPTNFAPISVGRIDPIFLRVPILDDLLQEGDEVVDLSFLRPRGSITLGGEYIPVGAALGRSSARLNLLDNDFNPGEFIFAAPNFATNELATNLIVTVRRIKGSVGQVSVEYFTVSSGVNQPAQPGVDYTPVRGALTFRSGETSRTFVIPIVNDTQVEFDENIGLVLTNATGGAKIGTGTPTSITTATATILDNDFPPGRVNFAQTSFTVSEAEGYARVTVTRSGGNVGAVTVDYLAIPATAGSPADFAPASGTLVWNNGDSTARTIEIPLVADGLPESPESFSIVLFNPTVSGLVNTNLLGLRTNTIVVIQDGDAYGSLAFNQAFYQADESGGTINITVVRSGGIAGTGTVNYNTEAATARPGIDYIETSGTLTFGPGVNSQTFQVTLLDDTENDGQRVVNLVLSGAVNVSLGTLNRSELRIVDNRSFNEPAGSLDTGFAPTAGANGPIFAVAQQMMNGVADGRLIIAGDFTDVNQVVRNGIARLQTNGLLDTTFDPGPGANASIRAALVQADGKILVGGFFDQVVGTNRSRIARLNPDGSHDSFFNPGAGADNPVYALALQPDGKILVGGAFSTFNSITRPGIVRLNTNGTVDLSFAPGAGANGPVYAVALQADGRIVIGGEFTEYNGITRARIARLNRDGSLDLTFNPGAGLDAAVRAIAAQPDGAIVAGGSFTMAAGLPRGYLARFLADGALDNGFLASPLTGTDGSVFTLALQVDGKIVAGGDFTQCNGVTRNRLTRLNTDGSSDPTINFGAGANAFVTGLLLQPDRKIVLVGGFTEFDGEPRLRIARVHGGAIAGSGSLEFARAEFLVDEHGTNAVITVRRRGGTTGAVGVQYQTLDGTALAGTHYVASTGTLGFPQAETEARFLVPIIDNFAPGGDKFLNLNLSGYSGGATPGPQPFAVLRILDDEGLVGFSAGNFSVNENVASGFAVVTVQRSGATNAGVSVNFTTLTTGTATAGADFVATNGTINFLPGELSKSFHVRIANDLLIEGNETVGFALSNPSSSNQLGIASAILTIIDNDFAPGRFVVAASNYQVSEGTTNLLVTVLRTNGSTGIASVRYRTVSATALGDLDFVATNNVLAFADGETVKTVALRILDDLLIENPETFAFTLSNPTGGTTLGPVSSAVITITDNDVSVIVPAGSTLISESISNNNIIDPGETVTLALALRNQGSGNTVNLVGTLLAGNGVTAPSGPQTYGVLVAGGFAVAQNFTFTALGGAGDRVVATLLLTDNGVTNGFASFAFTLGGQATRTVSNPNGITINDNTTASPYPSTINVANLGGQITSLSITISNFTHSFPDDVDILLVSPLGEKVTLMSDVGGNVPAVNATLTFSATATNLLPDSGQLFTRTYLPTNFAGLGTADTFPAPAPGLPYTNSSLATFEGLNPNGVWQLYVVDDNAQDVGSIGGWSMRIQTSDPVTPAANLSLAAVAPNPVALSAEFPCSFTVTNRGPSSARDVVFVNEMPSGLSMVRASTTLGTLNVVGRTMTWSIGSVPTGSSATVTVIARANTVGTMVNRVSVGSDLVDLNPADNASTVVTTVVAAPVLTVTRVGGSLQIAWPALDGFELQAATTLGPADWSTVNVAPQQAAGMKTVVVPADAAARYYRLRSP